MIKNDYKIFIDYFILYVTQRNGCVFEIYFDIEEIKFVDELDSKIFVDYNEDTETYYAKTTDYIGIINGKPKSRGLLIHRLIMGVTDPKVVVDHKDFDTLNNRKDNLRIIPHFENNRSRASKNTNNKTGYRNVCQVGNRLWVQLQINGKNTLLKTFALDELEKAGKFAEEMRIKYYGEFCGNN